MMLLLAFKRKKILWWNRGVVLFPETFKCPQMGDYYFFSFLSILEVLRLAFLRHFFPNHPFWTCHFLDLQAGRFSDEFSSNNPKNETTSKTNFWDFQQQTGKRHPVSYLGGGGQLHFNIVNCSQLELFNGSFSLIKKKYTFEMHFRKIHSKTSSRRQSSTWQKKHVRKERPGRPLSTTSLFNGVNFFTWGPWANQIMLSQFSIKGLKISLNWKFSFGTIGSG